MLPTDYITRINSKKYVHKDSSNEKKASSVEKQNLLFLTVISPLKYLENIPCHMLVK